MMDPHVLTMAPMIAKISQQCLSFFESEIFRMGL